MDFDAKFDHAFEEMRAARKDMRGEFAAVRGEIAGLRGDVAAIRGDLAASQRQVTHILAGFVIALFGVIAAGVAAAITAAV